MRQFWMWLDSSAYRLFVVWGFVIGLVFNLSTLHEGGDRDGILVIREED